ncbi:2285_t:CDS:2, partial [Paraglomus occultum]
MILHSSVNISHLPNELLASIFSIFRGGEDQDSSGADNDSKHLTERLAAQEAPLRAIMLTCRLWSVLAAPLLWKVRVLDSAIPNEVRKFAYVVTHGTYFPYGDYVERLRINIGPNITPEIVQCVADKCRGLKYLCLVGTYKDTRPAQIPDSITNDNLPWGAIARNCRRIDSLVLMSCLYSLSLSDFVNNLSPLQRLALIGCPPYPATFYVSLTKCCGSNLRRIYLRAFEPAHTDFMLNLIAMNCPEVKDLFFCWPPRKRNIQQYAVTSVTLSKLLSSLRGLRHLSLFCFLDVNDKAFKLLAKHEDLRVLDMPLLFQRISLDALNLFAQHLTKLEYLNIMAPSADAEFIRTMVSKSNILERMRLYAMDPALVMNPNIKDSDLKKYFVPQGLFVNMLWHKHGTLKDTAWLDDD